MPLDEGIVNSVANADMKTVAEMAAHSAGLAMQNAVANQQAMFQIQQLAIGSLVKSLLEMDPAQAASVLKTLSGNEPASQIAALMSALASGQQQAKAAQTTPPVTAQTPATPGASG